MLIDSSGKAVLCDFGLSRIKADSTSCMIARSNGDGILGSRNWMAPELLLGGSLKKPCDIYAFGMTLFEVSGGLNVLQLLNLSQCCERFVQMKSHWVISMMPISFP